jgi:hypothetical protein
MGATTVFMVYSSHGSPATWVSTSPWRTTHHRCHSSATAWAEGSAQTRQALRPSPGVGDYPHPASPQAGRRSPLPLPRPAFAKRLLCSRRPRQREPIGEVRVAAASFTPLSGAIPFEIVPPCLPSRAVPRPWREETPEALPYPILHRLARRRSAAPRLAVRYCDKRPPRAGGAAGAARG